MDLSVDPAFLVVQAIPFLILVVVLKAWIFDPMLDYLEVRNGKLKSGTTGVKSMNDEAERMSRDIEARVAAAREENIRVRKELVGKAAAEEERLVNETRAAVEAESQAFRTQLQATVQSVSAELKGRTEEASREIATRLLGRSV